eukprot:487163_1
MECSLVSIIERSICNAIVYVMGLIFVCWFSYYYVNARRHNSLGSTNKRVYYMAVSYFITIMFAYIMYTITSIFECINTDISAISGVIGDISYGLQFLLLLLLLFFRLFYVFDNTSNALSRITISCFCILYIGLLLAIIITVLALAAFRNIIYTIYGTILFALVGILGLTLTIWLIGLFIYKLIMVFKNTASTAQHQKMVSTVTKQFILALMAVISFVLFIISAGIQSYINDQIHMVFIIGLLVAFDLCANFFAIVLGFGYFKRYYYALCGKCDTKFYHLCEKIVQKKIKEKGHHRIYTTDANPAIECGINLADNKDEEIQENSIVTT